MTVPTQSDNDADSADDPAPPSFLFCCCQAGAESALKAELAERWPNLRPAFSRPGFVTCKITSAVPPPGFDLQSVFARAYGFSLGRLRGQQGEELAADCWRTLGERDVEHVHVWQRDTWLPGQRGFEPGASALADEVGRLVIAARPRGRRRVQLNRAARVGQQIADLVVVEPDEWWLGWHQAGTTCSQWPGGVPTVKVPFDAVSRAYRKAAEALLWSRLPIRAGDVCVEIGSAPGGAAQALLDRELTVIGVDPAEMDKRILKRPNFVHLRKRARDVARRDYAAARWLLADSNVAPQQTLDMVGDIVNHPDVHVQGMLLTLKLADWSVAERLDEYLATVRQWGYQYVRARQLAFNRREVCVVALRRRYLRRAARKSNRA